jgi:hypothetical protein
MSFAFVVVCLPSFRDGPKDQISDAQLRIGNLVIPGSMLRIAPERRPKNSAIINPSTAP